MAVPGGVLYMSTNKVMQYYLFSINKVILPVGSIFIGFRHQLK